MRGSAPRLRTRHSQAPLNGEFGAGLSRSRSSASPVSGAARVMSHRENLRVPVAINVVKDRERKATKVETMDAEDARPSLRFYRDRIERSRELADESLASLVSPFAVPTARRLRLACRFRVDLHCVSSSIESDAMRRSASSLSSGRIAPLLSSLRRRSISARQSSCTASGSSSAVSSRLRRRRLASSARAREGKLNASASTLSSSTFILQSIRLLVGNGEHCSVCSTELRNRFTMRGFRLPAAALRARPVGPERPRSLPYRGCRRH